MVLHLYYASSGITIDFNPFKLGFVFGTPCILDDDGSFDEHIISDVTFKERSFIDKIKEVSGSPLFQTNTYEREIKKSMTQKLSCY